jgi:hypothetical protein
VVSHALKNAKVGVAFNVISNIGGRNQELIETIIYYLVILKGLFRFIIEQSYF